MNFSKTMSPRASPPYRMNFSKTILPAEKRRGRNALARRRVGHPGCEQVPVPLPASPRWGEEPGSLPQRGRVREGAGRDAPLLAAPRSRTLVARGARRGVQNRSPHPLMMEQTRIVSCYNTQSLFASPLGFAARRDEKGVSGRAAPCHPEQATFRPAARGNPVAPPQATFRAREKRNPGFPSCPQPARLISGAGGWGTPGSPPPLNRRG